FNAISNKQLATIRLRNIHLEQLNVKVKHNNKLGYLNLKNYYFKYKRRQKLALNIDDVNISKGKVTAIIGHNGSGKSTFARCLTGVEKKFKGLIDTGKERIKTQQSLAE